MAERQPLDLHGLVPVLPAAEVTEKQPSKNLMRPTVLPGESEKETALRGAYSSTSNGNELPLSPNSFWANICSGLRKQQKEVLSAWVDLVMRVSSSLSPLSSSAPTSPSSFLHPADSQMPGEDQAKDNMTVSERQMREAILRHRPYAVLGVFNNQSKHRREQMMALCEQYLNGRESELSGPEVLRTFCWDKVHVDILEEFLSFLCHCSEIFGRDRTKEIQALLQSCQGFETISTAEMAQQLLLSLLPQSASVTEGASTMNAGDCLSLTLRNDQMVEKWISEVWRDLRLPFQMILEQSKLFQQQQQKEGTEALCSFEDALHKYSCDKLLDGTAAGLKASYKGLKAVIYAHIRCGYGDLGAAVNNACFLQGLGFTVRVIVGGNYHNFSGYLRENFEKSLGQKLHTISDLRISRQSTTFSGKKSPFPLDLSPDMLFDTYTAMVGDGKIYPIDEIIQLLGNPNIIRFSLAEFGFSGTQSWGEKGKPPTEFSMGLGPLEMGIPLDTALLEESKAKSSDTDRSEAPPFGSITVERLQKLKAKDSLMYHALLFGKLEGTLKDNVHAGQHEISPSWADSYSEEEYVQNRILFAGYGHITSSVVTFLMLAASIAIHQNRKHSDVIADERDRLSVDICLCSSRTNVEDIVTALKYYLPHLLQPGWYDRVCLQTVCAGEPGFTTIELGRHNPPANCRRTLRVLRQGFVLKEILRISHPFGLCTGDATLSEFLSSRKILMYDSLPHKQETFSSLLNLCRQHGYKKLLRVLLLTYTQCFPSPGVTIGGIGACDFQLAQTFHSSDLSETIMDALNEASCLSEICYRDFDLASRKLNKLTRLSILSQANALSTETNLKESPAISESLKCLQQLERHIYAADDPEERQKTLVHYKEVLAELCERVAHAAGARNVINGVYAISCAQQWSRMWLEYRLAHLHNLFLPRNAHLT